MKVSKSTGAEDEQLRTPLETLPRVIRMKSKSLPISEPVLFCITINRSLLSH